LEPWAGAPEGFTIGCAKHPTKAEIEGEQMSKAAVQPLPNALIKVVDLLVESRIRIDATEQILVKTNPVAYQLHLGTIENLQLQKTAEVNRVLTQTLKPKPTER
jgi:hypothetical protein